jgi:hypothetical protein
MDVAVLDEFPPWLVYFLAFIVSGGFLLSLTILIRSWRHAQTARNRLDQYRRRPDRKLPLFSGSALFFSIAGALALWFLFTAMFVWFHAIAIGSDRVDLIYLWPKPEEMIRREDIVYIKFIPSNRSCGYFELSTKDHIYKSVSFKRCETGEQLLKRLSGTIGG